MSVLIKDLEMPKNCLTCKLRGDGSDSKYIWDCPFTGFEYTREEGETGRLDDCPLIEVSTPHGDLIDRDALEREMLNGIKAGNLEEGYEMHVNINTVDDCVECVRWADAVIEAEEGEDE